MIKQVYSRRLKCKVYRLDARPTHGKRIRRFFLRRLDAEAVAYKFKHDAIMKRFGLPIALDRPLLSDLVERFVYDIRSPREQTRARRVLSDFREVLTPGTWVDEVRKADGKRYVDKRIRDGVKPQTVDRELNIIVAMFNKGDSYFSQLDQWRPPRMPRPKIIDGRRERTWSGHEIKAVLGELFAPKREEELIQSAIVRYQVGRKVQFSLLNGLRRSEMNLIPKTGINWDARQVRIKQGKTGKYKVIGPLGPTSMEILREFYDLSNTELVFSRSGNIAPKFYQLLREACQRAGVPYGRNTPDGLVLHDARHTATTHLLESNISLKTIQEWMGWSDKAFVLYYSHATKRSREQAGRSLERLAGHVPSSS
jgi:integrase